MSRRKGKILRFSELVEVATYQSRMGKINPLHLLLHHHLQRTIIRLIAVEVITIIAVDGMLLAVEGMLLVVEGIVVEFPGYTVR